MGIDTWVIIGPGYSLIALKSCWGDRYLPIPHPLIFSLKIHLKNNIKLPSAFLLTSISLSKTHISWDLLLSLSPLPPPSHKCHREKCPSEHCGLPLALPLCMRFSLQFKHTPLTVVSGNAHLALCLPVYTIKAQLKDLLLFHGRPLVFCSYLIYFAPSSLFCTINKQQEGKYLKEET